MRLLALSIALSGLVAPTLLKAQDLQALRDASRTRHQDPDAHAAYGRALLNAGRYRDARSAFDRARRLDQDTPRRYYDLAEVAIAEGNYRRARGACRPLLEPSPTLLGHVCMARAFLVLNRSARAFEEIEAALALDPGSFDAVLALGEAHRLRGSVSEAEEAYRRATQIDAASALPHLGLGRLYSAANRPSDARRAFRRALEVDNQLPDAAFHLGRLSRGEEAIELLRRATELREDWAEALVALGLAQLAAGRGDAAHQTLTRALELEDELSEAHLGLGRLHLDADRFAEAIASFERALEILPNAVEAVLGIAEAHARQGHHEPAFAEYRRAAGMDASNPRPLLDAARLALDQRRDVLAAGFLDLALSRTPNHSAALALYGDVMVARRDRDQARAYYERALQGEGEVDRRRVQAALDSL